MGSRYIGVFNALRALAAFSVFFFHVPTLLAQYDLRLAGPLATAFCVAFSKGYLAVDLFFILSGFVLIHVYGDRFYPDGQNKANLQTSGYLSFIVSRLARIYPMHLLTLGLLLLWHLLLIIAALKFSPLLQLPFLPEKNLLSLLSNLLLLQSWHLHSATSWNSPAWSISAEWFAYLLAPILIIGARRYATSWVKIAGLYVLLAGALYGVWSLRRTLDVTYDYGALRMVLEFAMGLCLYQSWQYFSLYGNKFPASVMFTLALAIECIGGVFSLPDLLLVLTHLILILSAAMLGQNRLSAFLLSKPLFYLGEISYSFYLLHGISVAFCLMLLLLLAPQATAVQCILAVASGFALCLGLSHLAYRYVECPARQAIKRFYKMALESGLSGRLSYFLRVRVSLRRGKAFNPLSLFRLRRRRLG